MFIQRVSDIPPYLGFRIPYDPSGDIYSLVANTTGPQGKNSLIFNFSAQNLLPVSPNLLVKLDLDLVPVTDIRFKKVPSRNGKVLAFVSCLLNGLHLRDIKLMQTSRGLVVDYPNRKLRDKCPFCECSNDIDAEFCGSCKGVLAKNRVQIDPISGKAKKFQDVFRPRDPILAFLLEALILRAYDEHRRDAGRNSLSRAEAGG
jgi:DNA-binding cell septation regulator SpoVG